MTVAFDRMYSLSGMAKKHRRLSTSMWEEMVELSQTPRLSLKQILQEENKNNSWIFDYVPPKTPQQTILLHRGNKPSDLETTLGNEAINQQLQFGAY